MKLERHIRIDAPIEEIGSWLPDFDRVMLWNPEIVRHNAPDPEALRPGSDFWVTYRLGLNENELRATVVEWEPYIGFEIHYSRADERRRSVATERVRLSEGMGSVLVRRRLDIFLRYGPLWARLLAGLAVRFGRPTEPGEPDRLKVLALGEASD